MSNLPAVLGLDVPNLLPESVLGVDLDWIRPAGRLIWSSLALVIAAGLVFFFAKRPKSPEPATWAMSILGAVGTFALLILAYGVVPHEWLTFANSYLQWGTDKFFLEQNSLVPFDVERAALKDAIAAGLYIVFLVGNVYLIVLWQKRPVRTEEPAEAAGEPDRTERGTSAYGRPVTAKG